MQKELLVRAIENPQKENLLLTIDSDPRKRFLLLSHPTNSRIINYVNLSGGSLILGLNEKKILTSLELNIPKDRWRIIHAGVPKPLPTDIKLLQFVAIKTRANVNELPVDVLTDEADSFVIITIGRYAEDITSWISVADKCFAGIKDNYLRHFWISLPTKQTKGSKMDR